MHNWKTTLMGWLSGAAVIGVAYATGHPIDATVITQAIGLAGVGTVARDLDNHSTGRR